MVRSAPLLFALTSAILALPTNRQSEPEPNDGAECSICGNRLARARGCSEAAHRIASGWDVFKGKPRCDWCRAEAAKLANKGPTT